jgi:hypothetical protein
MRDSRAFEAFRGDFGASRADLRFGRFDLEGEAVLRSDHGGMKVFWLYTGVGEVFLPKGFRTKEGDGQRLPESYAAEALDSAVGERLAAIRDAFGTFTPGAQAPIQAILSRWQGATLVGGIANDLWKLEHAAHPWSGNDDAVQAVQFLFAVYRDCGYSVKTVDSYERIIEGDQLIVAGDEELEVRGRFACLTLEKVDRNSSHVPAVMRLRYLKDSSGGCNFDFDPVRRLPLTWHLNQPGETGDGVNFVNSHVVNIACETSPTHFHPPTAMGGGHPQNEFYLVLNPAAYGLNTYGRQAYLAAYPDLRDLTRFEQHPLEPGHFVFIPPGTGHRGIDVFVNVITVPGFKPHNEFYIDQDVRDAGNAGAPFNESLVALRNYAAIDSLL